MLPPRWSQPPVLGTAVDAPPWLWPPRAPPYPYLSVHPTLVALAPCLTFPAPSSLTHDLMDVAHVVAPAYLTYGPAGAAAPPCTDEAVRADVTRVARSSGLFHWGKGVQRHSFRHRRQERRSRVHR